MKKALYSMPEVLYASDSKHRTQIIYWLIICAFSIYLMILLGGITRLTQSGLSMVEWKPITGILPPLGEAEWIDAFELYKQYPEYQKINFNMTIQEFKNIFYFEYFHRLLGRLIGFIFFIPFLIFGLKGFFDKALTKKLMIIFFMGALQGGLGWFMVKSGLIDEPHVSQYRLVAHLGFAVIIYGMFIWLIMQLHCQNVYWNNKQLNINKWFSLVMMGILYLMILSGGFVAGTKAGLVWNTFPLMGDTFIPSEIYSLQPFWLSAFEDVTTIQLNHRMLAYLIILLSIYGLFYFLRKNVPWLIKKYYLLFFFLIVCQFGVGITTLLTGLPVALAAVHQALAIIVFTIITIIASSLSQSHQSN